MSAGRWTVRPVLEAPELLGEPVLRAVHTLPAEQARRCGVAEIDPALADTAALCEHYAVPLDVSANCVVVTGRRAGQQRWAGCVVLATMRADVNGAVRRRLDVRKASFASQEDAVASTGMEFGGITPLGLPGEWPLLLDSHAAAADLLVVGSGLRKSKLLVPGDLLTTLPGAEVITSLALPA